MFDNSFHFAMNNVTDEIERPTSEILKEMRVSEIVTCDQQEVTSQEADSDVHACQHPVFIFNKHRCPIVNKNLDIIQQALTDSSSNTEEPFTPHVSKACWNKKYTTHPNCRCAIISNLSRPTLDWKFAIK